MQFSPQDIEKAKQLRTLGLAWKPQPGHYVWDEDGLIEQPSPFQSRVYFILDLKHFLRRAGSLDQLKHSVVWLPDWHDARLILQDLGVEDSRIVDALHAQSAIEHHQELQTLYGLIADQLQSKSIMA